MGMLSRENPTIKSGGFAYGSGSYEKGEVLSCFLSIPRPRPLVQQTILPIRVTMLKIVMCDELDDGVFLHTKTTPLLKISLVMVRRVVVAHKYVIELQRKLLRANRLSVQY